MFDLRAAYCPDGHSVILSFKTVQIYIPIQRYGFLHASFKVKGSGSLQITLIQFNDFITSKFACCQKLTNTHVYVFLLNICVYR